MDVEHPADFGRALPHPPSRATVLVLAIVSVVFDGYNLQLMPYIMPKIAVAWHIAPVALGGLVSIAFVGMLVGALGLTPLADRLGRKPTLMLGLFCFCFFNGLGILAHSYTALAVLRFLGGIGIGGVTPIATAYVSEFAPPKRRGLLIGVLFAALVFGFVLAAWAAILLVPRYGWRSLFWVSLACLLFLPVLQRWLPESGELEAARGGAEAPAALAADGSLHRPAEPHLGDLRLLFSGGRGVTTGLLWIASFFTLFFMFGFSAWLPSLMIHAGNGLVRSYSYGLVNSFAQSLGNVILGGLIDRFGRKGTTLVFYAGLAVSNLAFGMMASDLGLYIVGTLIGIFTAVQACLNIIASELYPAAVRATGVGWMLGIGRLGAIVGAGGHRLVCGPSPDAGRRHGFARGGAGRRRIGGMADAA